MVRSNWSKSWLGFIGFVNHHTVFVTLDAEFVGIQTLKALK